MLDLMSRLSDTFGNLIGGAANSGGDLADALANAGLDPSVLHGLDPQQIVELLASHGIDLAGFAPEQVQALIDQIGGDPGGLLYNIIGLANPFDRQ